MRKAPNSRVNLDKAIQRFAGDVARENELRNLMANAIVAQLIGAGVVKGGTGLKFRYGEDMSRATLDLDTAWRTGPDEFLRDLKSRLASGWCGFTGEVVVSRPASPRGVPFEYVMQPCDVKLSYLGRPWYTVQLEVGHNEIGDADGCDMVEVPGVLAELFEFLVIPRPSPIPAMKLEYQIAQKLHGASAPSSKRAHDLIDLQLIVANGDIDMALASELCRKLFKYRRGQKWPPEIVKGDRRVVDAADHVLGLCGRGGMAHTPATPSGRGGIPTTPSGRGRACRALPSRKGCQPVPGRGTSDLQRRLWIPDGKKDKADEGTDSEQDGYRCCFRRVSKMSTITSSRSTQMKNCFERQLTKNIC